MNATIVHNYPSRVVLEQAIAEIRAEQQATDDPERYDRLTSVMNSLLGMWART